MQDIACRFQLMVGLNQQDIGIPGISRRADRQPAKHIDAIDEQDVSAMVNIT